MQTLVPEVKTDERDVKLCRKMIHRFTFVMREDHHNFSFGPPFRLYSPLKKAGRMACKDSNLHLTLEEIKHSVSHNIPLSGRV